MKKSNNIISLVLGDWSHDGHGQSETINISSNLTKKEMEAAYQKGTDTLGFEFCGSICSEYEDNTLPNTELKTLIEHGFPIEKFEQYLEDQGEDFSDTEDICLDHNLFTEIYLWIVSLGNSNFKYKILKGKDNPTIDIGGYGLFYS